ncbi:MAG TPA: ubiquinol-cytochrome C chaperone family protein [Novosphingobium sp.]|nr:ubiquinol-cytochrome C chaperone family protein [Novosphingobium sp.]
MTLLQRLFRPSPDDRATVRPLWNAVVAEARDPRWYRELGVADSVEGRFDMVTLVLALVLLRLERARGTADCGVRLTELFIADMDAQLRQSGVGDLMVGKHMGKLMAVLGGRMGALREALGANDAALAAVLERNVTWREGAATAPLGNALRALETRLANRSTERLLRGDLV